MMSKCFFKILFYLVAVKCFYLQIGKGYVRPPMVDSLSHFVFPWSKKIECSFKSEIDVFEKWDVTKLWKARPFFLPPLKFVPKDMMPFLTEEQIYYHYGKHHANYVKALNTLAEKHKELNSLSLEDVIVKYDGSIFNNAAQLWNHNFYWEGMKPNGGGYPYGEIKKQIEKSFISFENFKQEFMKIALAHFGSGWVWVILENKENLKIVDTHDAFNPIKETTGKPILVLDIWEHAYYVDYKNSRLDYIKGWFEKINWDFANHNLLTTY